jgi:hypothetical protein
VSSAVPEDECDFFSQSQYIGAPPVNPKIIFVQETGQRLYLENQQKYGSQRNPTEQNN